MESSLIDMNNDFIIRSSLTFSAPNIREHLTVKNTLYEIYDLTPVPGGPTYSLTRLFGWRNTRGHSHDDSEETYFFIKGRGVMQVGNSKTYVYPGCVVHVPAGKFHRVRNRYVGVMEFLTISPKGVKRPPQ